MKELKVIIDDMAYEVSYSYQIGGAEVSFHVVVKDGKNFDFIVHNYRLQTQTINVVTKDAGWVSFDIAPKVLNDYIETK